MNGTSTLQDILALFSLKGLDLWPSVAALAGNGYFFVTATTILTLILVGVCLLVKYSPNLLNDLRNGSNSELPDLALKLWVVLTLAFPLFLDAGPLWFVFWWSLIFWGYLNIFEKRIVYAFIALIFMSGWLAHVGAGFLTYADTNLNRPIFTVDHSIGSPDDKAAVEAWILKHPADAEPLGVKAVWETRNGTHDTAVALLTRALDLEPNNSRYYNHLGVALADMGKTNEAVKAFQNASSIEPDNIIYHYNLSRIFQANFNFYESDRSIQKASSIDPEKVRYLLDREEQLKTTRKFIVEHVPLMSQMARQMVVSPELDKAADALWHVAFGVVARDYAIYIGFAMVLLLFLISHIPEEKFTKRCNRCGNHYYAGSTSMSGYPMCLQCLWIETKPKKQINTILTNKAEEIRGFRLKNAQWSSKLELILPGLGSFYVNRTLRAVLRLAVFSASLILIVTGGRFLYSFIPLGTDYAAYARISGVILAGLLYWRTYKSPPLKHGV